MITDGHCTTILAGKNTVSHGRVIHGHNEDQGLNKRGTVWFVPRGIHKAGDVVTLNYDVPYTYLRDSCAYWAAGNWPGGEENNNSTMGMNEWGVSLSVNSMFSKEPHLRGHGVFPRSLRRVLLSQCRTAYECVEFITSFIEKHGQRDTQDIAYCLADAHEAWVVETTARHWVAKRCPDDEILVLANHFIIEDDYDLESQEYFLQLPSGKKRRILSMAEYGEKKLGSAHSQKRKFNFSEAYTRIIKEEKLNKKYNSGRVESVRKMLEPRMGNLKCRDFREALRNHFAAEEAKAVPHQRIFDSILLHTVCNSETQSSNIWEPLSESTGDMVWHYAPTSPCATPYIPILAREGGEDSQEYSLAQNLQAESFWLTWNILRKRIIQNYGKRAPLIHDQVRQFEASADLALKERYNHHSQSSTYYSPFAFSEDWATRSEELAQQLLKQISRKC